MEIFLLSKIGRHYKIIDFLKQRGKIINKITEIRKYRNYKIIIRITV